ncbi:transglutaminase family protein [Chenggangzhangella methanolivorans]|uniref:Transglutaminase family protein n=1 Tax=Chenggangzhangella methanolivorans TaxID=1437009 RepID=A0A9E6UNB9_9HYPH|nr:transglutaminase family protein [Chenggangzhangella methanolivorans]QZN98339.1 transglutaminase family protein [Chenggangzhangella methanolivorans]
MIYDLSLVIAYDYAEPVNDARHILRVRPRLEPGQRPGPVKLVVEPRPDEQIRDRDFFGNALDHLLILPAHEALEVRMSTQVEVERPRPDLGRTPALGELTALARASRDVSGAGPMHFLGDSRRVRISAPFADYARDAMADGRPAGEAVFELAAQIKDEFDYAPGATKVDTPVEEAFAKREGVCQDFAHVMIAGLRAVGVPAAYVSGFLRTVPPPGKPRLEGADAMHAWVTAWLGPQVGWVGFDPTNAMLAIDDHITVAVGRDYADVAPIDGTVMTAGSQTTSHSVDVKPVEHATA